VQQGETENQVLAYAAQHKGQIEACVAKPGLITVPGLQLRSIFARAASMVMTVPTIDRGDCVAVMLDQVIRGFEKEPLENTDLVEMAKKL
jgi:hypothetical protein